MRPEKKWRPIIRMEVDKHYSYETVLGCDGQNVNMTQCFSFEDAHASSLLDVRVYYQSQTKKKGKRKKEVATAIGHPLGRLVKIQDLEQKLELRLQCQTQNKNTNASRGKPQKGACVILRIRPPSNYALSSCPRPMEEEHEEELHSPCTSDTESSHTLNMPPTPVDSAPPSPIFPTPPSTLRRRRVKGYTIYSDEEPCSSGGEEEEDMKKPLGFVQAVEELDPDIPETVFSQSSTVIEVVESIQSWIAASVIPLYTQQLTVPPAYMNPAERVVSSFTLYSELKEACTESEYQPVFDRLQREWQYVGGLVPALAAVNAAVFAISPDSLFRIQPFALSAIAASSMASGLGMAIDAWFLLRYNWIDIKTFIYRAQDVYGSYFFFALSSRIPAMCMFASAIALMAFLGFVAFGVWPQGVLVVCFFVGLIMTLQFLVFGVHWFANKVVATGKASKEGVVTVVRKMTQSSTVSS
ncbi:hypothetical protein AN958_09102 [Leucoagaricus sp. SymC.cos]|nr:hypothetical protein AN958_09102 [Leucoagaricus sp. SymC.cos]